MPTYDFKCMVCYKVKEQLVPASVTLSKCSSCGCWAERQLSAPAGIRMGDGTKARRAKNWTSEPVWRYPDGHIESLNSANTRPEE